MSGAGNLAPIGAGVLHVACDMQRLFAERTPWQVAAIPGIVEPIAALAEAHPTQTIFTRFVTPLSASAARGAWRRYYEHWSSVTLDRMDAALLDIVEPLSGLAGAAEICDKTTYSAFASEAFVAALARRHVDTLIFSGVETDVCVLATLLTAVDRGYRVVIAADAVASSSRAAHRATLETILPRLDRQVEIATVGRILAAWPAA